MSRSGLSTARSDPRPPVSKGDAAADAELMLAAVVARRHFVDDESKVEIGQALGISRFKVARLLALARSAGIVHIDIREPVPNADSLSVYLRERYSLAGCEVVRTAAGAAASRTLGEVAATVLERLVADDDVLGLPWTRTVHRAVQALHALPAVPVVQLCGSMVIPDEGTPTDVVRRAVAVAGAGGHLFHAPLIMPTEEGAQALRAHDDVARAMAAVPSVTVALCSVGAWSAGGSTVFDHLTEADRAAAREAGVIGETMGVFIGAGGELLDIELSRRLVTITAEQLGSIPTVIATAHGSARLDATRSILQSGAVTHLIADVELARLLAAD